MKKPSALSSKSLLLATGITLAAASPVSGVFADEVVNVSMDQNGIYITPGGVAGFISMNVRIMDANGNMLLETRSTGEAVDWICECKQDGMYRYEVAVITEVQGAESSPDNTPPKEHETFTIEILSRRNGNFNVVNGEIVILDNQSLHEGQDLMEKLTDSILLGAAKVLNTIVPVAQAAEFDSIELVSSFPQVQYDDEDVGGANRPEWSLTGFEGPAPNSSTYFTLTDLTTAGTVFRYVPGGNGSNTFFTLDNGDIMFAGGSAFLERNDSSANFGINTITPSKNFQINDLNPTIRLQDESDATAAEIIYDGGQLSIDPGNKLVIEDGAVIEDSFAGTRTTGDGLSKLVALSANNDAAGLTSDVGFTLENNKTGFTWNFRTQESAEGFVATKQGTGGPEMTLENLTDDFTQVVFELGNGFMVDAMGNPNNQSTRASKENIETIDTAEALETLKNIMPVKYNYKKDKSKELYLGFIAEDVPDLVAVKGRKHMNPMDVVAMLTKVVQEQQKALEEQREMINALQTETLALKKDFRSSQMVSSAARYE